MSPKRWTYRDVFIELNTAEKRLKETAFLVEADSFADHEIWRKHSVEAFEAGIETGPRGTPIEYRFKFEQCHGWLVTVGEVRTSSREKMPCTVSLSWSLIDGYLVCFHHATSLVVDHRMIQKYLRTHFSQKWDSGTRESHCDAENFHLCADALRELARRTT